MGSILVYVDAISKVIHTLFFSGAICNHHIYDGNSYFMQQLCKCVWRAKMKIKRPDQKRPNIVKFWCIMTGHVFVSEYQADIRFFSFSLFERCLRVSVSITLQNGIPTLEYVCTHTQKKETWKFLFSISLPLGMVLFGSVFYCFHTTAAFWLGIIINDIMTIFEAVILQLTFVVH